MASIDRIMEQKMNQIRNVINTGLKVVMGEEIRETLLYYLEMNFYSKGYGNKADLAESLSVDVVMDNKNTFTVKVYFDDNKIGHESWFGSQRLGIYAGDSPVYTAQWINDGWSYMHGSRNERLRDFGLEPQFMEDALKDLKNNKGWIKKFYSYLRINGIDIEN